MICQNCLLTRSKPATTINDSDIYKWSCSCKRDLIIKKQMVKDYICEKTEGLRDRS